MIEIRQANLADKQAISEFIKKAFGLNSKYKFPERWEWQFEHNPFRTEKELPIWIAVDELGVVVGQTCAMIEPLQLGKEIYPLGWSVETYVLPEYRGHNLGYKLQKANSDNNDLFMSLNMSDANRYIKLKLGGFPVDKVTVFNCLVSFQPGELITALRNRIGLNFFGKILITLVNGLRIDILLTVLINLFLKTKSKILSNIKSEDVIVEETEYFDESINDFWNKVSPNYPAIIKRDYHFLKWKYELQPFMNYKKFITYKAGEVTGYLILRVNDASENNFGIVADLLVFPDDQVTMDAMLAFALHYFRSAKVKYIQAASSIESYKVAFKRFGFREQKDMVPIFHSNIKLPEIEPNNNAIKWFLSRSDHDWDLFSHTLSG